jgi:hypothetical protein
MCWVWRRSGGVTLSIVSNLLGDLHQELEWREAWEIITLGDRESELVVVKSVAWKRT